MNEDIAVIVYLVIATVWLVAVAVMLGYEYQVTKNGSDSMGGDDVIGIMLLIGVLGGLIWPLTLAAAVMSSPFWVGRGIGAVKRRKLDRATEGNR